MGDLTFEENLIAGVIQSRDVYRRAARSGIDAEFFEGNEFNSTVFSIAKYLDAIGNEFTTTAFEDSISLDASIETKDKGAFISRVRTLATSEFENIALAVDKMREKRIDRDIHKMLQSTAMAVKKGEPSEEILERVRGTVDRLATVETPYEIYDYWAGFEARQHDRVNRVIADDNFRFRSNLHPFDSYFPGGLPGGTTMIVSGPTFSGKSVTLNNIARVATHPDNGLDVVYIVSENTTKLTGNRLDALYLDKKYTLLFKEEHADDEEAEFFRIAQDEGWGRLIIGKVVSKAFDANTIRAILDEALSQGLRPRLLLIDSPDHQRSIRSYQHLWQEKGEVYLDNKAITEEYDIPIVATAPLKAGSSKSEHMNNEMIAGSQDISRHVDFQIMFNTNSDDDKMLNRARFVVTKNREYLRVDGENVDFYFSKSSLLRPYNEVISGMGDREQYTVFKRSPDGTTTPVVADPAKTKTMEIVDPETGEVIDEIEVSVAVDSRSVFNRSRR